MREKMQTEKDALIENIIDRDMDFDLGARAAKRSQLYKKTLEELRKIWEHNEEIIVMHKKTSPDQKPIPHVMGDKHFLYHNWLNRS